MFVCGVCICVVYVCACICVVCECIVCVCVSVCDVCCLNVMSLMCTRGVCVCVCMFGVCVVCVHMPWSTCARYRPALRIQVPLSTMCNYVVKFRTSGFKTGAYLNKVLVLKIKFLDHILSTKEIYLPQMDRGQGQAAKTGARGRGRRKKQRKGEGIFVLEDKELPLDGKVAT